VLLQACKLEFLSLACASPILILILIIIIKTDRFMQDINKNKNKNKNKKEAAKFRPSYASSEGLVIRIEK